jgi:competence protein ComGC
MKGRMDMSQRGFSFVAVLLALLVAAVLYFGYFKLQSTQGERSTGVAALDASRSVACRTNRQSIERAITAWQVNHPEDPPTLDALQADGFRVPQCPEGGQYQLVGREVHCSRHP